MRKRAKIFIVLGVALAHSDSLALAQTERPLNMFDLLEMRTLDETSSESIGPESYGTAEPAPSKSIFDLFKTNRVGSRSAVDNEHETVGVPRSRPVDKDTLAPVELPLPSSGVTTKEKESPETHTPSAQNQKPAQETEPPQIETEPDKQKEEREKLLADKLDLEAIRKSLESPPVSGRIIAGTPAMPTTSFNADAGRQSIIVPQKPTLNRSNEGDETTIARAEPDPPPTNKWEDARLKSSKCQKAKAVIEGYAFTKVQAKSCVGDSYLFSAHRDKNVFSIKINPQTGELTEITRAAPQALNRQ